MTKSHLELVPPTPPDHARALIERIKAIPRPPGALVCSKCGGMDTLMIRHGDRIEAGRVKPGQVIEKGLCPHCWKRGVIVDMIPSQPREVKPPKLRRTKTILKDVKQ